MSAQPALLFRSAHAPDGVKAGNQARREERRFAAGELRVIDLAASDELVLQPPRERGLGILLNMPRHDGVAAAADRDVERRARPPAVGQAGGEADLFDEALRVEGGLDLPRGFPAPAFVAVLFDVGGNFWLWFHAPNLLEPPRTCSNPLEPPSSNGSPCRNHCEVYLVKGVSRFMTPFSHSFITA